jgi:hypothetical protein
MPKVTINEAAGTLVNFAAKVDFNDLIRAGNGGQIELFTLPAGAGVLHWK